MPYRHRAGPGDYQDRFLFCRGTAHRWAHVHGGHWEVSMRGGLVIDYRRTLVCDVCGSQRIDVFDADMRPVRTRRTDPPAYLTEAADRIDGPAARLEEVRRLGLMRTPPRR
jgi:hypothetical protein